MVKIVNWSYNLDYIVMSEKLKIINSHWMVCSKKTNLVESCWTLTEALSLTITRSSVDMSAQKAPISDSHSQNDIHGPTSWHEGENNKYLVFRGAKRIGRDEVNQSYKNKVEAKPATDWGQDPAYSQRQWDIAVNQYFMTYLVTDVQKRQKRHLSYCY